jgi:hypothetical protein
LTAQVLSRRESTLRGVALFSMIALPAILIGLRLARDDAPFVMETILNRDLMLSQRGEATLDLPAVLELHDRVYPRVSLNLPLGVHLLALSAFPGILPDPTCSNVGCVLELDGLTSALGAARLRFDAPGRYVVRIGRSGVGCQRKETIVLRTRGVE